MTKAQLILEDGTVFTGVNFSSDQDIYGEVVINTSMTGYQEILTDPAYYGKIVLLAYPLIGNYGINRDDFEGVDPQVKGLIVKEIAEEPSNFRADEKIEDYLSSHGITGLKGIDTRKLVRHLRNHGTMKGSIRKVGSSAEEALSQLTEAESEKSFVKKVATEKPYVIPGRGNRIVVVDLGLKHGILRSLTNRNCHITVVPYDYTADEISRLKPEGIIVTSGPGNPALLKETIEMTKEVMEKFPFLGIGMGQQILALAAGAETKGMFNGHHGAYAVKDLAIDKTYMTTQNHQYELTPSSLENTDLEITHLNLYDESIEGIRHKLFDAFAVQFYPESTPGPEDARHIIDQFITKMNKGEKANV